MTCEEYREWVAADVDGELGDASAEVRNHVDGCPICSSERRRQAAVRGLVRSRSLVIAAPAELRSRILTALDRDSRDGRDREHAAAEAPRVARRRISAAVWAPLALAAAAVLAVLLVRRGGDFAPLIQRFDLADRGTLALALRTDSMTELETFYRKQGGDLPVHVVDLSGAGFRLVGGTIESFPARRARLSVYTDGEHTIVCDYQWRRHFPFELPANGEPVFFRERGVSFCARRVGDEVCLLATRMPVAVLKAKLGISSEG